MGEQFRKYYYSPKVPFLQKPEKQKNYRREYIHDVGKLPEPESLSLMSDKMQLEAMEAIGDRSSPNVTRQDLANFYMRRNAQLQHKKYKLLTRWANIALTSIQLDDISPQIEKAIGILQ